jgi:hypothetical protein
MRGVPLENRVHQQLLETVMTLPLGGHAHQPKRTTVVGGIGGWSTFA